MPAGRVIQGNGVGTMPRQPRPKPMRQPGRREQAAQPPQRPGEGGCGSALKSGPCSGQRESACARKVGARKESLRDGEERFRRSVPWSVKRFVVLSRSTVIFCTRGGEFLYQLSGEKR